MELYNEDCLEGMKRIPDGSIDAIITDPPFWTTACKWDSVIPFEPMWKELKRIIKPNWAILLFWNEPFTSIMITSNLKWFKYRIDWNKIIPSWMSYAKYRPMSQIEDICIFTKDWEKSIYNPQMIKRDKPIKSWWMWNSLSAMTVWYKPLNKTYNLKNPTTLIEFDKIRKNSLHPTQKPVTLIEYLIRTYTNEWETVLDFTMWSGTTWVACKNTNRNFIGIEMDKNYFDIATKRINNL